MQRRNIRNDKSINNEKKTEKKLYNKLLFLKSKLKLFFVASFVIVKLKKHIPRGVKNIKYITNL